MTTAARQYREMQSELAHANRVATMGQLAASIAHEVNQPIASSVINALAGLRWLNHPTPDLEEVRRALAAVVSEGNRAGEVINRIRDLIKKAPPRKDRLEINEVIREVIELTRGEAVKNGVSVEMQFAEGLPLIEGDRVQLQQVILNLVLNSVQAMSATGDGPRQLLVTTGKADSDGVLVAVRDSGPGLAPAALEHIFEAFYTTKPDGMGMGLSICRSIIEAHGGRLWATRSSRGVLSFSLRSPLTKLRSVIDVAYWHKADVLLASTNVCCWGQSGSRGYQGHQYAKEANVKLVISKLLREAHAEAAA